VPGKPGRYRVRKEPLLPELYRYLYQDDICGWSIRHKFVVQLGVDYPDRCADVNHTYRMVKERVDACEKKLGDGTEYVFSHCRGYCFDTLVRIAKRLSPADYWRLVSRVWTDSEKHQPEPRRLETTLERASPGETQRHGRRRASCT
jgi:hypothetical protein